ncbi:MAG: motility associated factor glycosyltransferase family protein [Epsilonproteobacteria bacterium]|nr:motility associated factor glycosyltransferase family protein [Campylobacterota bacterium]
MNNIQQQVLQTFKNNLIYLSQNHPEVYKKVDILNQAIENGSYKEKYELEYKDEGYFDVLDTVTNEWLYGSSSIEKAKEMAKEINYRKDKGVIETFYNYSFDDKAIEYANEEDPTVSRFVLIAPVVGFLERLIDKNTKMKHIYKFMFFGVGLGLHVEEIHHKIDASMYFIIEDNLELFRLSLFVTDFSKIGKDSELYFAIMCNDATLKKEFEKFYHNSFIRNNYIKYSLLYPNYREKIAKIQNFIVTQSSQTYLHDKLLKKNVRVIEAIKERFNFFDVSRHYGENSPFAKRPIVLVAAGPSLAKEIEWLKKNAPFVTVVALFMTSAILYENGIKPDIILHIDENYKPVKKTLDKIEDKTFFKDSIFLLAPSVEMELFLEITSKDKIFVFEDRTRYRFNKGHLESVSVGEIGYALSLLFGAKDIYLLGLDLALDPESKSTHAKGHLSSKSKKEIKDAMSNDGVSLRGSEFYVKGNFLDKVPTLPVFDVSIHLVNEFSQKFKKPYQNVYNLNNGAYFEGAVPTKSYDVDLSDFQEKNSAFISTIYSFLMDNASSEMDEEEKIVFKQRVQEAKDKRFEIVGFASQRYPSMEQFQKAFVRIAENLIYTPNKKAGEISQIYSIYLENIGGYIGDFFNTVDIDNPKRNIKKFQKIISKQFLKIIDKYLEFIE